MSVQTIFVILTGLYMGAMFVAAIGILIWLISNILRRRRKTGSCWETPKWLKLLTIGASLIVALVELCLFVGKWNLDTGLSSMLWIILSALWIAEYRRERK